MSADIISKKTRQVLREHLSGCKTLHMIEMTFDARDVRRDFDWSPSAMGQRRSLVEQYYHSLNFADWNDATKFLNVYRDILIQEPRESAEMLAKWLLSDGFIFQNNEIVPISGNYSLENIKTFAAQCDAGHMAQQIKRIETSTNADPSLAIGSAKELLETTCKTILQERGKSFPPKADLMDLVKIARAELRLMPENISDATKGAETIKRLLGSLGTVVQSLSELRNLYGSGHGKEGRVKGVQPRHARLVVGSATTLCTFLLETHNANKGVTE